MASVADQQGYALLSQPAVAQPVPVQAAAGWGSAAYILVFVVVFIIIIAFLAMAFWGGSAGWGGDSSDDDRHHKGGKGWNFEFLAGLIIFIIVLLFLCWLMGSFSHRY